jgi:P-type Cu+ transporter
MIKQIFKVTDMTCANCAMHLESLEDELPGVRRIDASYRKSQMMVEYDENQLSVETILGAVRKKGYTAQVAP